MTTRPSGDLTRTTLAVLFIFGMIAACFLVLQPFLASTVWAATLVLATWPVMLRLEAALGGRRGIAVSLMALVLLLLVMAPIAWAISAIVNNAVFLLSLPDAAASFKLPGPPDWVKDIPLVGRPGSDEWQRLANSSHGDLARLVRPYLVTVTQWIAQAAGSVGTGVLHLLLTIAIAVLFYLRGEQAADWCRRFGRRLADDNGERAVVLAGQAIRGVALGVVVTALAQTLLAGIGLSLAGVPQAGVLTAVTLFLCIAQLGPGLVLVPAIIWLFVVGNTVPAIVLLVISIPTVTLDNVLRPILIRRGADLPLLLILVGVIGGLLAFGLLGLFVGPVILAVTHTLVQHWIANRPGAAP
jgi:predicted PurR-regulated permease PerM